MLTLMGVITSVMKQIGKLNAPETIEANRVLIGRQQHAKGSAPKASVSEPGKPRKWFSRLTTHN